MDTDTDTENCCLLLQEEQVVEHTNLQKMGTTSNFQIEDYIWALKALFFS